MRTLALDDNPGLTVTHLSLGSGVRRGSAPGGFDARFGRLADRRTNGARGVFRGFRRAAALVTVTMALVLGGTSGALATPTPTPTPAPVEPTVILSPLAHGVVPAGSALTATIEVSNPSPDALDAAPVVLELGVSPLPTSEALDDWIDTGDLEGEVAIVDRPAAGAIAPGESEVVVSTVVPEALAGRAPGVYALSATYGGDTVARSVIVLQGETPTAATIGMIVAVTATPRSAGLLTADELSALTAPDGRLTSLLSGVAGTPAILAIDPSVLASIRVLGDAAPSTALAWLDRLTALPNERFALQFADADVSVQADAGLTTLLEPSSLAYAMSADDFTAPEPAATPTPSPSATDTEDDAVTLPDLDELVTVPGARASLYWPARGLADPHALNVLAQQPSASGSPATVLLSSTAVERSEQRASATTTDGTPLLVYEAGASDAVRDTAGAPDGAAEASSALISAKIALGSPNPTGPLLITTERMADVGASQLRAALDSVYGYPGVVPATLSTLVTAAPADAESSAQPDENAAAALQTLLAGEASIADFSSIIDDPSLLTAPERTSILQLIGAGWRDEPSAWQTALAAHAEATTATLTSVSIQEPSTVQLVSPEAVLPFFIRNDLPFAANVVLVSVPDSLRLDVERTLPVRAEPGVNTRAEVPVRARVGSGQVTIELRLLSPTFDQVGPIQRAEVTVRAEWERIGIIGLSAIVVVLLGAGLIRTVLRRRRARAADGAVPNDADDDESPQDDPTAGRDE